MPLSAQYYVSGQDRGSIHWKQINQEHFRVIFPEGQDSLAKVFCLELETAHNAMVGDFSVMPKKVNVIIHQEAAISNAMVVWAPKRMEVYTTWPQDIYNQDWMQQLAIHEYRHVIQISQMRQGVTNLMYYLFGEQIVGGILGLYIPSWYLEGDAVFAETKYSTSGRGRQYSFREPIDLQLEHHGRFSYDKATFGSYKDEVPNQYEYGYQIVTKTMSHYGDSVWNKVLRHVARNPWQIVPFNRALKKFTAMGKLALYDSVIQELDQDRLLKKASQNWDSVPIIYSPQEDYENYDFPHYLNDSCLFALKTSLKDIPRFVKINLNTGKEEVLYTPGPSNFYALHNNNNEVIWSEKTYDLRWSHRNNFVLKILNIDQGEIREIKGKYPLFAPQFCSDNTHIVCVEQTYSNDWNIKVYDRKTLQELYSFKRNNFPITPTFTSDDKSIIWIEQDMEGKHSIISMNMETQKEEVLFGPVNCLLSSVFIHDDALFFMAEFSGVNQLYRYNTKTKKISQISGYEYGLKNPCDYTDTNYVFAYPTKWGLAVAEGRLDQFKPLKNDVSYIAEDPKIQNLPQMKSQNIMMGLKAKPLEIKKYSKLGHLFNIHSWSPFAFSLDYLSVNPGIKVLSQNALGTAISEFNFKLLTNEQAYAMDYSFSYEGWYPSLSLNWSNIKFFNRKVSDTTIINQNYLNVQISQKLNFSKGKYINFLQPSISSGYLTVTSNKKHSFLMNRYRIYWAHYLRSSHRDLAPRWGQILDLNYRHASDFSPQNSWQWSIYGKAFFPGFFANNSFTLSAGIQKEDENSIFFTNQIPVAFGENESDYSNFYVIKSAYNFPIAYPDWSLGALMYMKRLKGGVFYDFIENNGAPKLIREQVIGAKISMDTHFFRTVPEWEVGLSTGYGLVKQSVYFKLLFSYNI